MLQVARPHSLNGNFPSREAIACIRQRYRLHGARRLPPSSTGIRNTYQGMQSFNDLVNLIMSHRIEQR
jgi:hypothetical protein